MGAGPGDPGATSPAVGAAPGDPAGQRARGERIAEEVVRAGGSAGVRLARPATEDLR